jgi:Regulator of chromosome condensation (RCC1) repeat
LILDNGICYSWGNNGYGELGIGNTQNQNIPQLVLFPQNIKIIQIRAKWYFSISITSNFISFYYLFKFEKMNLNVLLGDGVIVEDLVMIKKIIIN